MWVWICLRWGYHSWAACHAALLGGALLQSHEDFTHWNAAHYRIFQLHETHAVLATRLEAPSASKVRRKILNPSNKEHINKIVADCWQKGSGSGTSGELLSLKLLVGMDTRTTNCKNYNQMRRLDDMNMFNDMFNCRSYGQGFNLTW